MKSSFLHGVCRFYSSSALFLLFLCIVVVRASWMGMGHETPGSHKSQMDSFEAVAELLCASLQSIQNQDDPPRFTRPPLFPPPHTPHNTACTYSPVPPCLPVPCCPTAAASSRPPSCAPPAPPSQRRTSVPWSRHVPSWLRLPPTPRFSIGA